MRKEFALAVEKQAIENKRIVFLTGDLGFMALENVRSALKDRFINMGVSEQNMIGVAAGLASEGLIPICYSIAPFAVFRPAEHIRIDVCLHNLNVKIVGNGGGYGYGIMGATHHAIEDLAFMSSLQNMKCYIPFANEDVDEVVNQMLSYQGPCYLRLGVGQKPNYIELTPYHHTRQLLKGDDITVVGLGPVLLNIFQFLEKVLEKPKIDMFVISELPIYDIDQDLQNSIKRTKKLLIIEEHVKRGGLGENLAILLLEKGIHCRFIHAHAKGYPNGLYGNQDYHQTISGLDSDSLTKIIERVINEG